ncbi:MAG TPA: serine/threonine-protein kinase [Burkholderiales bacterium]|jgi:serine/threonine protein kinase|nr:serine/threonine-protein kinase [Burkholderiales bacterium]
MSTMTQLGRYKILGELGRGAMGVVYRAEDPVLDRPLAIKTIFISADDADRKEYEARFTQEARAAGKLAHPGIVTIYDVGREGDLIYMAMELLEGTDLATKAANHRFPVAEAVGIVEQVADALAFAHDRGVVHRDIKPPNIMLVGRGRVKIMDFGIARMRSSDLKTQTGMMLGTPRYMSPEQVAGRPVDQRSDIFSLGTVLYEMLTGTRLFSGADATEIMYNVAQLRPVPPSRINRQVPAMLDLVVAKALEKDAGERYQDAHQFAADLRACLNELGVHRPEPDRTLPPDRTLRMGAGGDDKTARLGVDDDATIADAGPRGGTRAQVIIVDSNTRLRLSQVFDSGAAVKRLTEPQMKDHARLVKSPRPPTPLTRFWFDPELRLLGFAVLSSILVGTLVAAL